MPQVRSLLHMEHASNRLIQRRLRAIAEERASTFQLFKLGKGYFTTLADVQRLIPELFTHEDGDSLRSLIERQAIEMRELRRKVERMENSLFSRRAS